MIPRVTDGRGTEALSNAFKRLKIAQRTGDYATEGILFDEIGDIYKSLGDVKQAIHYHELYLKFTKEVGDRVREGCAYCNLGNDYAAQENFKQAIRFHKLHLKFAKEVGDYTREGIACNNLGHDYKELGDVKKAIHYHERHLKLAKDVDDRNKEGIAYYNLGLCYSCISDFENAIRCHELYMTIAKELGDRAREADAYGNLGNHYLSRRDFKEAIHYHELYQELCKEIKDRAGEGIAYGSLGLDYSSLEDFKKSICYHELSLKIAKEVGNRATEGAAYGNLGNDYQILGDFQKAIHYHELCLEIVKEVGDRDREGDVNSKLGIDYAKLGDFKTAIHYHEIHLDIAKNVGNRAQEGSAYCCLGNDYSGLGDCEKAINFHKLFLKVSKEVGNRSWEGVAYGNLGTVYTAFGDLQKAIHYHGLLLSISKEFGYGAGERAAYTNLGNNYHSLGYIKKAIHYHEHSLKLSKEVGDSVGEGEAYNNLGCIFESQGSLPDAATCYQSSIRVLNDVRARLQFKDKWKISLGEMYKSVYINLRRALLKQDKVVEALIASDKGRAQALKDLMECKHGLEACCDSSGTLGETTYDSFNYLLSNVVFVAIDGGVAVFWIVQARENVKLRMKIVSDTQPVHDLTTYIYSLMKIAFEEVGVRGSVKCEDRSLDKLRDEDLAFEGSQKPPSYSLHLRSSALKTLYELVISPIEDVIHGSELVIVPDGPLWLAPYAAFMDTDTTYLSETFRIRLIPSLATLKLIRDCPSQYHRKSGALLVGDPWVQDVIVSDGKKLHQLPCAREEVEMIGRILGTEPLTGKEATKNEVLKRLSSVALVHIAAHGRMETGEIALSPNLALESRIPMEQDFLLTMTDVLSAQIRARLVVLSSCHSGRGEIKAEGVVGIARAFLGAGARSVLVSLWAIDDEATLEFMKNFYQHLVEGISASEALNRAMKSMRESDKFSEVKYWAPFVLIGDDVTLEFGGGD